MEKNVMEKTRRKALSSVGMRSHF